MVGGYDVASHVCVCVDRDKEPPLVREVMFMSAIKIVTESSPFVVLRGALEGKTEDKLRSFVLGFVSLHCE